MPTLIGRGIASIVLCGALCGTVEAQVVPDFAEYGAFLDSLMLAEGVPGISFAFFNRDGVLWEHVSGVKRAGSSELIGPETVFEAASISKPIFGFVLHSLAFDGVLDLGRPLAEIVEPLPEVAHDDRSALLTPRMLLSHQGGLPNWRTRLNLEAVVFDELFGPEDTLRFVADPGDGYRYSGEGFVLLQQVVEAHTRRQLPELAATRVFGPFGMTRTTFSFNEVAEEDYAFGHSRDGRPDKWGLRVPLSSSTLHTTGADLGRFGAQLASEISNGGRFARMAEPVVTVAEDGGDRLSWGLGLGVFDTPAGRYVYHGGNNVIIHCRFHIRDRRGSRLCTAHQFCERARDGVSRGRESVWPFAEAVA
jgi:CubicO group peptidase (beta-lactamase class C family)